MAHFEYSSVIAAPRTKVFEFVANLKNLKLMMEPDYKIEITSPLTPMTAQAEYQIRVSRFGLSVLWGIIIEEFKDGEIFRDRQSQGPFALWVHTHKFEDHGQGTLLTDVVEYDVAFGLLGKLADDIIVSREMKKMFTNRHKKIQSLVAP